MARITFQQIIAEVQRKPGLGRISLGEIMDAIGTAAKDLGNQPWPWNYAETNILIPAALSGGTVSITNQTNIVTGIGTSFPLVAIPIGATSTGWRIRFGNSNLDYIVATITPPALLTLAQPVNLGANLVNATYTLYQDSYSYPGDYIVGSDVALLQPLVRTRIPKIPRYKFEMIMNAGMRSFSTNIQMFYCDQGQQGAFFQMRIGPPPSGPAELRLCYHQMAPDLVSTNITTFPQGYDEIISLTAASKLYDLHKMPGESEGAKTLAAGKIRLLKRQVATQTIDDVPDMAFEVPDSSISQWGMMISRP